MKAKELRFTPLRWYTQLHVLPINLASIRSKLKNFTSIHYPPSLLIGWAEHSRCSHWAVTDGGGTTCHDGERGGRRPQTHKTPATTNMDKLILEYFRSLKQSIYFFNIMKIQNLPAKLQQGNQANMELATFNYSGSYFVQAGISAAPER